MSMISLNSINRKIKDTEKQIEGFGSLRDSELAKFEISELNRRLQNLLSEKEDIISAQARELILLRVYGENIDTGRISNRILVSMLDGFQTMVDNIANVLAGNNGSRGQLKDYAQKISDFEVCGIFAGSFGIKLEKNYKQLELTNISLETNCILQEFFGILENSSDGEKLIERISPYGQRTVNQYRKWLKDMKENAINLELAWTNEVSEQRKMDIKFSSASDIIFTLDSIGDIREEEVIVHAMLTGINIRKNTFELKTDEDKIIKGKSCLETLIKISDRIGEELDAKLINSKAISSVCESKEAWFLSDIIKE